MGIKHLYQLIEEHAPASIKKGEIKNQFGRKVAIVRPEYNLTDSDNR
jgi:flap endonuclease-1